MGHFRKKIGYFHDHKRNALCTLENTVVLVHVLECISSDKLENEIACQMENYANSCNIMSS